MPRPKTTYQWMYRFDSKGDDMDKRALEYLQSVSTKLVVTQEQATNLHYHCYIETTKRDKDLKAEMRDVGEWDGNKNQHSAKKWDDSKGGLKYILKGADKESGAVIMFNNYLSDDEIRQYHDDYWATNAELKSSHQNKTVKKRQLPWQYEVTNKIYEEFKDCRLPFFTMKQRIAEAVIDKYVGNDVAVRPFKRRQAKEIYEAVILKIDPVTGEDKSFRAHIRDCLMTDLWDTRL